jgi:MFS family permease
LCRTMQPGQLDGATLATKDPAPPEQFSRSERLVIAACAISMLIVQMDWFALNLALPAVARQFKVPPTDLQWVISGYMLSIDALMVTAGRLADIFGRRRIIVIGLAVASGSWGGRRLSNAIMSGGGGPRPGRPRRRRGLELAMLWCQAGAKRGRSTAYHPYVPSHGRLVSSLGWVLLVRLSLLWSRIRNQ